MSPMIGKESNQEMQGQPSTLTCRTLVPGEGLDGVRSAVHRGKANSAKMLEKTKKKEEKKKGEKNNNLKTKYV
jgi:hypothetical protein